MRNEKTEMFNKLKGKRNTKEYEQWFLKYQPGEKKTQKTQKTQKTRKTRKTRKTNKDYKLKPY